MYDCILNRKEEKKSIFLCASVVVCSFPVGNTDMCVSSLFSVYVSFLST